MILVCSGFTIMECNGESRTTKAAFHCERERLGFLRLPTEENRPLKQKYSIRVKHNRGHVKILHLHFYWGKSKEGLAVKYLWISTSGFKRELKIKEGKERKERGEEKESRKKENWKKKENV